VPHYGRRSDAAQPGIVDELRAMGFSVILTHRSGGDAPDIIVGKLGITVLVEIKSPHRLKGDKQHQIKQAAAREAWLGDAYIRASTTAEIIDCFQRIHAARRAA
jgi:Holliday junction resolvase